MSEPDPIVVGREQLVHELHNLSMHLERYAGIASGKTPALPVNEVDTPLDQLCDAFDLNDFERAVVVMCAGVEIDAGFTQLCAKVNGDPALAFPTFGLAMATAPDAHWAAASPAMALRRWSLVETGEALSLARTPLRIDEAVLHFLLDGFFWDDALAGLVRPIERSAAPASSHATTAEALAELLSDDADGPPPAAQLVGPGFEERRAVISWAAAHANLTPFAMSVHAVPAAAKDRDRLSRRWERTARLLGGVLVLEDDEADTGDEAERDQWRWARQFVETAEGPVVLSGRQRRKLAGRPLITLEMENPQPQEQRDLWADALGSQPDDPLPAELAGAFNLGAGEIRAIAIAAVGHVAKDEPYAADDDGPFAAQLAAAEAAARAAAVDEAPQPAGADMARRAAVWSAARMQLRPGLENLAQRVEGRSASWDDLVAAPRTLGMLREIADQTRYRGLVRDQWGFGRRSARGQGVTVLFAGGSGAGKTFAAEVLANEIGLDLFRIDLSAVVDKYIGETEKNLARLFDAADNGASILFFDEADVLFGKRTEVKDGRDRYANIEVGYLLQRLETFRGLAILSSNMREGLDAAFVRRIRFIVDFGYPDASARARLWRIAFPPEAPLDEAVDVEALADLQFSGGQIAAIAINAAYLAAAAGEPINMGAILSACRHELSKASQPLDHPLLRGARP